MVFFMKLQDYDFDQLKTRFSSMSDSEVLQEYADICNSMHDANDAYGSGDLSWEDFSHFLETISEAKLYLAGFLAYLYMQEHGYSFSDDGRWLPCGT